MKHSPATDHGTIVEADQAALVVDPDGSFRLLLPDVDPNSAASYGHTLIMAIAVQMNNHEWVADLMAALEAAASAARAH